jgi:hypothetical protein
MMMVTKNDQPIEGLVASQKPITPVFKNTIVIRQPKADPMQTLKSLDSQVGTILSDPDESK